MIIRCPDCSTGFKLPEDRITSSGIKLRCSRCSHVFRVRRTEDGENEIFYHDEDRVDDTSAGDASEQGDDASEAMDDMEEASDEEVNEAGNRTMFGMPSNANSEAVDSDGSEDVVAEADDVDDADDGTASERTLGLGLALAAKRPKRVEISGNKTKASFNPFPHTGLDLKPKTRSAFGDISDELATDIAEATAAATGVAAVDEVESVEAESVEAGQDLQAHIAETSEDHGSDLMGQAAVGDVAVAEAPVAVAAAEAPVAAAEAVAAPEVAGAVVAEAAVESASLGIQGNSFLGGPEDFIDSSFEHDGPYFDPDRERVEVGEAVAPAVVAAKVPARPVSRRAQPGQRGPGRVAAQSEPVSAPALEPVAESWEVDDVAVDQLGGSTGVKLLLITLFVLLIGAGFVGFVAAQNDGLLDFKQFGSMVEVAFGQGEYTPRSGQQEVAPVVAVVEEPIEVHSVFAELAGYGKVPVARGRGGRAGMAQVEPAGQVLVLRGQVRNREQESFSGVKLRGLVLNQEGRVLLETTAFLGGMVSPAELEDVNSVEEAVALLPGSAAALNGNMAAPFTLIFDEIPTAVLEKSTVMYRVEVIKD